ncbi:MAG: glycoside hydrolase family 92 protein [Fibrella sp.]|nr:glycoside hydrolase family 92 protein [Armatimonadota bacterium]
MKSRPAYEPVTGLVAFVNPLQGTDSKHAFSTGNTLPLIAAPHGMTHWSPQTNSRNDGWFFHPSDPAFTGIRATHQPSPWMGDYGYFLLMPQAGVLRLEAQERESAYRTIHHRPDYFAAQLQQDEWTVAFAPTERCAILGTFRDRSTKGTPLRLLLERFGSHEEPMVWDKSANCVRGLTRKNNGGVPDNWAFYFVLSPDSVITDVSEHKTDDGHTITVIEVAPESYGFQTRIGTSFISTEQADANLAREVGNAFVHQIAERAGERWNELLGRITLTGATTDQERTFYSCLYRALLFPRVLHEPDTNNVPHHFSPYTGAVLPGVLYTDNGFWDTFRTVYPLLALAYPDILGPVIDGWLNTYRESGFLPEWASPGHRACMVGTHSQAVIADAVANGIAGFDYETALEAVLAGATQSVPDNSAYGRAALAEYESLGYVPCDRIDKATSRTLDYAYDDYCVAQIARAVGRDDLYEAFLAKSERWRNVWDADTKFFRGRLASGEWLTPFNPTEWGGAFVEGSAYQFRFSVPHNPAGLAQLWGGAAVMAAAISEMVETPPTFGVGSYGYTIHEMAEMAAAKFGQYAHSNQPVHATLHMAAAVGVGEVTNRLTHRVLNEYYTPETLPGDEDNGEMGAWYVLAALGIFPLCPGSGEYVLNTPLFDEVRVALPGGSESLRIFSDSRTRPNGTDKVEKVLWNNTPLSATTIRHEQLVGGGELHFRTFAD